jgi:hypothetical protein
MTLCENRVNFISKAREHTQCFIWRAMRVIAVRINTNGNTCLEVESLNQFGCVLVAAISGFPYRGNYSC